MSSALPLSESSAPAVAPPADLRLVAESTAAEEVPAIPPIRLVVDSRLRRLLECTIAASILILLMPLLVVIAILIGLTSRGPVLFRQDRAGRGGVPFVVLKFRTMTADAEDLADTIFSVENQGSGPLNKLHEDPRVTPVGRVLRRLSLDELPQLWNVLNGTMALVGPRPTSMREVARFRPEDHRRHAVRPGITGLPQVSGRSDLEWEQALQLDLDYIERRSLLLDLQILIRTPSAVIFGHGAY